MKEQFKQFVKKNPILLKYINSNDMSWQKFYEMYDLYGEDNEVWNKYLKEEKDSKEVKDITKTTAFADFISFLKTINLDSLQEGIGSIQRVLGVFQDFSGNKNNDITNKKEYKPRPLYKHFED